MMVVLVVVLTMATTSGTHAVAAPEEIIALTATATVAGAIYIDPFPSGEALDRAGRRRGRAHHCVAASAAVVVAFVS